jgi:hypothetical protein
VCRIGSKFCHRQLPSSDYENGEHITAVVVTCPPGQNTAALFLFNAHYFFESGKSNSSFENENANAF